MERAPGTDPSLTGRLADKFVPHGFTFNLWRRHLLRNGVVAIAKLLEPGEDALVIGYAKIGVHPALSAIAGIAWLDIFEPLFLRPHLVTITDRRLLLVRLSVPEYAPERLRLAAPRREVSTLRAKETWSYYSVWIGLSAHREIVRLNFPYSWENEGQAIATELSSKSPS